MPEGGILSPLEEVIVKKRLEFERENGKGAKWPSNKKARILGLRARPPRRDEPPHGAHTKQYCEDKLAGQLIRNRVAVMAAYTFTVPESPKAKDKF